jgi:hypothetical protein
MEISVVGGTGTVTINGAVQSKQVTQQPATAGTGLFTVNGALQTKAAGAGTPGIGSVAFSGSEQSKPGTPALPGTASITINGSEAAIVIDPCFNPDVAPPGGLLHHCPHTIWDLGCVSVTVNGFTKSVG